MSMSSSTRGAVSTWQDALPYALWRAQQAVHRRMQSTLDGLGVTPTQLGLAVHLDELGPLSASDLARAFRLTPQSVTTALTQLERLGWVRRLPHPVHKRVILNELTAEGLAGITDGRERVAGIDSDFVDILGSEERGEVVARLRELTVALEGEDPPPGALWPVSGGAG
jgi:DNA-binding MarR family transcriptional regulator